MSERKICYLEDVCESIYSGGTPDTRNPTFWGGGVPWLSSGETRNKFVTKTDKTITRAGVENSSTRLANIGSTVIASAGQGHTRGQTSYLEMDTYINQSVVCLKPDPRKVDALWLFYNLSNRYDEMRQMSDSHSSRGSLTTALLKKMKVSLPPKQLQESASGALYAIDKKIELNQRMNETLEAMARALFKGWFVDFDPVRAKAEGRKPEGMDAATSALFPAAFNDEGLPEGWERGTFGSIAESAGTTVQPSQTSPDTPYIGLEHMPRRCIALSEWEGAGKVTSNKFAFLRGDFLFGKLRPYFHKVGIAAIDGISSTDILIVRPKREEFYAFVLSVISSTEFVGYTDKSSQGTKMPRTNWKDMARYELVLPDKTVALAYNNAVKPMLEKIIANVHENRTLSMLRDALLPKLISGELRIDDAKGKRGK